MSRIATYDWVYTTYPNALITNYPSANKYRGITKDNLLTYFSVNESSLSGYTGKQLVRRDSITPNVFTLTVTYTPNAYLTGTLMTVPYGTTLLAYPPRTLSNSVGFLEVDSKHVRVTGSTTLKITPNNILIPVIVTASDGVGGIVGFQSIQFAELHLLIDGILTHIIPNTVTKSVQVVSGQLLTFAVSYDTNGANGEFFSFGNSKTTSGSITITT